MPRIIVSNEAVDTESVTGFKAVGSADTGDLVITLEYNRTTVTADGKTATEPYIAIIAGPHAVAVKRYFDNHPVKPAVVPVAAPVVKAPATPEA